MKVTKQWRQPTDEETKVTYSTLNNKKVKQYIKQAKHKQSALRNSVTGFLFTASIDFIETNKNDGIKNEKKSNKLPSNNSEMIMTES